MYFRRFLSVAIFCLLSASGLRAQTTNILNLCTEAALRAALEIGGNYRVECSTNAAVTINLTSPLIVRRDINLIATNEVLLSGQNLTRIMIVEPGVRVTLSGFLFFSGRQTETNLNHGGIDATAGAGLYNNGGIVTILRGRFNANSVIGITGNSGEDGSGEDGEAGGDAAGAAIFNNAGQVLISNVVFEANTTTGGVGGKGGNGRVAGFGGNGGNGGEGGTAAGSAIFSSGGSVIVFASTFTNNTAIGALAGAAGIPGGALGFPGEPGEAGDGVGAAISSSNADITVYACTFITNSVRGANGQSATNALGRAEGQTGRNGGDGAGGAIYSTGRLSVTNSTFFGNLAVSGNGGAGGAGGPDGFGNDGGNGGNGGFATGGAIESAGSGVIVNCTFSDNTVTPGLGGAGGLGPELGEDGEAGVTGPARGGAIYASGSEVVVANSILANSTPTVEGNVRDAGGNISTDLNPLINSFASFRLTNPFLLPLASNGGPTATMAITTNSPGIDRGVPQFCPDIDQRGTNRTGNCDIGAYEISVPPPPIPPEVFATNNFRIFNRSNEIIIRWTAGFTNLFLQETTDLRLSNTVWTTITDFSNIRQTNDLNFLTITPDLARPRAFYRLFGDVSRTNSSGSTFPFPQPPGFP
jgi:hypothetical protein